MRVRASRGQESIERVRSGLEVDAGLRLILLQDLPDGAFGEKDVVFLLKISPEPPLSKSSFLADLLQQLDARLGGLTGE